MITEEQIFVIHHHCLHCFIPLSKQNIPPGFSFLLLLLIKFSIIFYMSRTEGRKLLLDYIYLFISILFIGVEIL